MVRNGWIPVASQRGGEYDRRGSKTTAALRPRLVVAESAIRHERHRLMQHDKSIALDDAIELT